MSRNLIQWAGFVLLLAVILGAYGAHALRSRITADALNQWRTGVEYQFYHGLGLLMISLFSDRIPQAVLKRIGWCFQLGVLFFCGSLYLLSTRELAPWKEIGRIAGPMTPLGGLFFIAGWAQLMFAARRTTDKG